MDFFFKLFRLEIPTRSSSLVCYVSRPSNYIVFNHFHNVWCVAQIMKHFNHYVIIFTSYFFLFIMPMHPSAVFVLTENLHIKTYCVILGSKQTYFSVSHVSS
jgi:hypothetical protein